MKRKQKICPMCGKEGEPSRMRVVLKYSVTKIWSIIYIGKRSEILAMAKITKRGIRV